MLTSVWNENNVIIATMVVESIGDLTATLDAAAVINAGGGRVTLQTTAHGFAQDSILYFEGTQNYNGMHRLLAVTTNSVTIEAKYVAETFAGTETMSATLTPGQPFDLQEVRFTLSSAATQDEFNIDLDSHRGSTFDARLRSIGDMNCIKSFVWIPEFRRLFSKDDKIRFQFANSDNRTLGLEIIYRTPA